MRTLAANLTSAALLAHALLGCCWHHQHAGSQAPACSVAAEGRQAHGPCSHADSHTCDSPGEDHEGPVGCDDGRCMFVAAAPQRAAPTLKAAPIDLGLDVATCVDDVLPAELPAGSAVLADVAHGPPLPRHLLHEVLLL